MTDLGGHCMETLVEAFDAAAGRCPDPVHRLDDQGLRPALRRPQGQSRRPDEPDPGRRAARRDGRRAKAQEWEPLDGVGDNARPGVEALIDRSRIAREKRGRAFGTVAIPALPAPAGDEQSTQAAFGRILLDLSKAGGDLADRIVTTSPDVTVSTNLGAWVNQRGLFKRREMPDVFAAGKDCIGAKMVSDTIKASTSSWASRNPTCS